MSDPLRQALSRAAVYRVLAVAFSYPCAGHGSAVAGAAAGALPGAPEGVRSALAELVTTSSGLDADALAEQYVALFDRQLACSPYEGAYGTPQLSGKAMQLADIAGFYAAFGMTSAGRQRDAEDHIGAQLEFMSALALKEAWARAQGEGDHADITRDAERAFLEDHLGRWGDAFAARLLEVAPSGFFAAAARLLTAWLHTDCAVLAVAPSPLERRVAADESPLSCPMA